jgi:hypothetical protein
MRHKANAAIPAVDDFIGCFLCVDRTLPRACTTLWRGAG